MRAVIKGKKVTLRKLRMSDADKITEYCQDPAISRWTRAIPYPYKKKNATGFIKKSAKKWGKEKYDYVIISKNELVGIVCLILKEDNIAELGYWIGKPHRGQGFATGAARMLMKEGFKTLKLHRITSWHFPKNKASERVMQKLGMKYEGTFREHVKKGSKYMDAVCRGILKREFKG